jgi:hypothetical protein
MLEIDKFWLSIINKENYYYESKFDKRLLLKKAQAHFRSNKFLSDNYEN